MAKSKNPPKQGTRKPYDRKAKKSTAGKSPKGKSPKSKPNSPRRNSPRSSKKPEWLNLLNDLDQKLGGVNPFQNEVDQNPGPDQIQPLVVETSIPEEKIPLPQNSNLVLEINDGEEEIEPNDSDDSDEYNSSQDDDYSPTFSDEISTDDGMEIDEMIIDQNELENLESGGNDDDNDNDYNGGNDDDDDDEFDLSPEDEAMAEQVTNVIVESILGALNNAIDLGDDDDDEDDEENVLDLSNKSPKRVSTSILIQPAKRRKLDKDDREYKSILGHREKDLMEHFSGLPKEEKLKIITEEKYIIDNFSHDEPLRIKVINSNLPSQIKAEVLRKMSSGKGLFGNNSKLMTWIDHIMRIPWGVLYPTPVSFTDPPNKISDYITTIYDRMEQAVYGHYEAKCHIMQIVGKWITNPAAAGNCLALEGPMGVGKTTLVKEGLAPALGRPFNFISLGGASDAAFLNGHSFTYEGSIPGQIAEVIQRSGCMNPIIYFDELDKISKSHKGEEIANLLVHLTDTQQNERFHDKYFGNIDIDLSKAFFVFSYNNAENISPILRDRLQVVKINGYTSTEKSEIMLNYMLPRFCSELGFEKDQITVDIDTIKHIICRYAEDEKGVRNLGRAFETLLSRLNVLRLIQGSNAENKKEFLDKLPFRAGKIPLITNPFQITHDVVNNVLTIPKNDGAWTHMYT